MELVAAGEERLKTYMELWFSLAKGMEKYSDLNQLVYDGVEEVSEDGFLEQMRDEDHSYYLIEENREAIGFTVLKEGEHPSREYSKYTKIINLFIKEEYRSQGYGSKAIEKIKEAARENGSDHLKVSSEWENRGAREFYEDNGFEEKQVNYIQKLDRDL